MSPDGNRSLTSRMVGAALLSVDTYEDVENDTTATGQAAAVVALAAAAQAVGAWGQGLTGIVGGMVGALVAWLLWSGLTYLVGDKLFGGTADWGELLRTAEPDRKPQRAALRAQTTCLRHAVPGQPEGGAPTA